MVRLRYFSCGIGVLLMSTIGCDTFHNLQTHRLQRLNRGVDGMPTSAYFSVSDTLDKETTSDQGQPVVSNRSQIQLID